MLAHMARIWFSNQHYFIWTLVCFTNREIEAEEKIISEFYSRVYIIWKTGLILVCSFDKLSHTKALKCLWEGLTKIFSRCFYLRKNTENLLKKILRHTATHLFLTLPASGKVFARQMVLFSEYTLREYVKMGPSCSKWWEYITFLMIREFEAILS